ncbi:hypothetical protein PMAYCL1PPCAC_32323, partial [Pristionchus mayeri]
AKMRGVCLFLLILPVFNCWCPEGFELVRDGQCRGLYTTVSVSHSGGIDMAVSKCMEINAQPIIIHTQEQNTYWTTRDDTFPIGIVCNNVTKKWQWADGSLIDYKPPEGSQNSDLDNACSSGCTWQGYTANGDWNKYCDSTVYSKNIFCTTQLEQPIASADGCDSFEDDSEDGVCYQIGESAENWQGAQLACQQFGANLASIHSDQENTFVRRLAVSKGAVNGVLLGATTSGKGYDFAWIDGTDWDYANFHPGFPETGLGDCLAMDTSMANGYWMNMNCTSQLPVACIRDQKPVVDPFCSTGPWKEGQLMTSPGFPFSSNTFCDYFLTVEVGKKVEVVIKLEANTCCDYLTIYDGQLGGVLLANLTGEVRSKVVKTTTSNTMRVNWQPDGGANVRGLAMSFRGVLH